jgi:hypothetical protein
MNILIIILLVIASLIALFLIVALFSKKGYSIERETIINKSQGEVFNYIKHLRNQDHYSKWVMMDPAMKKTYTGTDGSVGFVYAWEGNKKAGKGEQEIIGIKEGERLDVEVRFVKPFEAIASTPFVTEAVAPNQTKVKWGLSSTMKYPMNGMLLFMNMDKLLGKDLEVSLGNLKGILENN